MDRLQWHTLILFILKHGSAVRARIMIACVQLPCLIISNLTSNLHVEIIIFTVCVDFHVQLSVLGTVHFKSISLSNLHEHLIFEHVFFLY